MVAREEILIRNKIIGVLLRTARLRAGESIESCAQVLSCDPEYLTRAEEGDGGTHPAPVGEPGASSADPSPVSAGRAGPADGR